MTYRELFYKATRLINNGEITLGEYEEMTKPLDSDIEQEPSGDLISRQAVLDLCDMRDRYEIPYEYDEDGKHIKGYDEGRIINVTKLNKLPSVKQEPKTGHWEQYGNSWEDRSYEGECNDYGCFLAKKGHDNAPMLICMLPKWIKKILLRYKTERNDKK